MDETDFSKFCMTIDNLRVRFLVKSSSTGIECVKYRFRTHNDVMSKVKPKLLQVLMWYQKLLQEKEKFKIKCRDSRLPVAPKHSRKKMDLNWKCCFWSLLCLLLSLFYEFESISELSPANFHFWSINFGW